MPVGAEGPPARRRRDERTRYLVRRRQGATGSQAAEPAADRRDRLGRRDQRNYSPSSARVFLSMRSKLSSSTNDARLARSTQRSSFDSSLKTSSCPGSAISR